MVHGPEEILQVRIDNPLMPLVQLPPFLRSAPWAVPRRYP